MTTIDWIEVTRRHLARGPGVSSVSSAGSQGQQESGRAGAPLTDKTDETPIRPVSSVSSVGDVGFLAGRKRGLPLPPKPTKPESETAGPALRSAAERALHDDPALRRAFKAAPQADGLYRIGVAVRMEDGTIASAVLVNVNATWEELLVALGRTGTDPELFEERVRIREFDAGLRRPEAEGRALLDLIDRQCRGGYADGDAFEIARKRAETENPTDTSTEKTATPATETTTESATEISTVDTQPNR